MAQAPQVQIVGLRALTKDLARASDPRAGALIDAMKAAGKTAAAPVAAAVISTVPHDSGDLAGTVRLSSTRTGAAVRMGKASVPYAGPVDFGGPLTSAREFIKDGRYLFPAALALGSTAAELYSSGIARALDAFNWTNETGDGGAVHE